MSNCIWFKRQLAGLFTVLIAAGISSGSHAACRKAPLGSTKDLYYSAMAQRMAAAHGVGMKRLVQKGYYAGSKFAMVWYRFGTAKEIENATGIRINDDTAPGAVTSLLFFSDNSETNLARLKSLTVATVNYFAHIDESQIASEIDTMLKKVVAAEPSDEDVSKPGWKLSFAPVVQHDWGNVHVEMPTSPRLANVVNVKINGLSCK